MNSHYFTLAKLDDGVYAAIAKEGVGAWSNAGIVDLGDKTLVFDSFGTPSAGLALYEKAHELTGRKPTHLINSHYHGDHVFGNQWFSNAEIFSTSLTKELFAEKNKMQDVVTEQNEMRSYLTSLKERIKLTSTTAMKKSLTIQYNELTSVYHDLPALKLTLPNQTFERTYTIQGTKRHATLHCLGGGHTPSDTFMVLPKENIAFMGDLVTENLHVPIYDPENFYSILRKANRMNIKTFVPGHGNLGSVSLLTTLQTYLSFLMSKTQVAISNQVTKQQLLSDFVLPSLYTEWIAVKGVEENLSRIYDFYERKKTTP